MICKIVCFGQSFKKGGGRSGKGRKKMEGKRGKKKKGESESEREFRLIDSWTSWKRERKWRQYYLSVTASSYY